MIDQQTFERIIKDMQSNVLSYSRNDVEQLVLSILEMDKHLAIAQQALEFTMNTSQDLFRELANACANVIGIRDVAKKKRMAAIGGKAAAQLAAAVQMYIAGQIIGAQEAAGDNIADVDLPDEVSETSMSEEE